MRDLPRGRLYEKARQVVLSHAERRATDVARQADRRAAHTEVADSAAQRLGPSPYSHASQAAQAVHAAKQPMQPMQPNDDCNTYEGYQPALPLTCKNPEA